MKGLDHIWMPAQQPYRHTCMMDFTQDKTSVSCYSEYVDTAKRASRGEIVSDNEGSVYEQGQVWTGCCG